MIVWLLACGGEAPVAPPAVEVPVEAPTEAPVEATPTPTEAPSPADATPAAPEATPAPVNTASVTTAPATSAPATAPGTPAAPTAPATPAQTASTTPVTTPTPTASPDPVAPTVEAKPVTYTLDATKSSLYVQVFKDPTTVAADLSHDHVVAATGWTGTVTWGAGPCAVDISVPVAGLRNDDDAMRKRVGYDVMLDEGQRADVKANMLGASQLDASRSPTITYKAASCEATDATWKVTGALTIRGVAKRVITTLKVSADGARFSASGKFTAKTTDFGFEPFSAMLGALKNKAEMKFTLDVVGTAKG